MKISIAMAAYNGEKYILEQLESFVKQSRLPDELVITDDCSTDKTMEIIKEFKNNAPFEVKIYTNQENLGYTQNFNKALALTTGELIFLSDQDDVWFPTKIEYMIDLAMKYQDKALYMIDTRLTDENLTESEFTKQGQICDLGLTEKRFVMGCCIAIKKNLLQQILPIPNAFTSAHDDWLVTTADMLNLRYIDSSIQQYYRIHGKNTSPFIANNLFKMKKIETPHITFRKKLSAWSKNIKISSLDNLIGKKNIFIDPLHRLLAQKEYHQVVNIVLDNLKGDIALYESRLQIIKSQNIYDRISQALKLYRGGGYKSFNGFKSCFSDVFRY